MVDSNTVLWVVFTFDYPGDNNTGKTGYLKLDSIWFDETASEMRAAEAKIDHDEAWSEGIVAGELVDDTVVSLEDGSVVVHLVGEDVN